MDSREEKLQRLTTAFTAANKFRNDVAEDLEAFYIANGGFLRRADLAAHVTLIEDPVTVNVPRLHRVQMRSVDPRAVSLPGPAPA